MKKRDRSKYGYSKEQQRGQRERGSTALDVLAFAAHLGIDVEKEKYLLWIAEEALLRGLPDGWGSAYADNEASVYFFETHGAMGKPSVQWEHPNEDAYLTLLEETRRAYALENLPPRKGMMTSERRVAQRSSRRTSTSSLRFIQVDAQHHP